MTFLVDIDNRIIFFSFNFLTQSVGQHLKNFLTKYEENEQQKCHRKCSFLIKNGFFFMDKNEFSYRLNFFFFLYKLSLRKVLLIIGVMQFIEF